MKDEFLNAGDFLALRFSDGYYCFRVMGKEMTNLKPYEMETALAAAGTSSSWTAIPVSSSNSSEQIQPTKEHKDQIYQVRYGVYPSRMQIYTQFISRQDRGSLVGTRAEGGAVGHVDGEDSPYMEPTEVSEFFSLYERSPVFKAYNPTPSTSVVDLNFKIAKLYYWTIKNRALLTKLLSAEKRCKFYTMGLPGENPMTAPTWLSDIYKGVPKSLEELGVRE
jgi:hypothetical protein